MKKGKRETSGVRHDKHGRGGYLICCLLAGLLLLTACGKGSPAGGAGGNLTDGAGGNLTDGAGGNPAGGAGENSAGSAGGNPAGGAGENLTDGAGGNLTDGAGGNPAGGAVGNFTGGADGTRNRGGNTPVAAGAAATRHPEYVYVPRRITLADPRVDYGRMQQAGDSLCYISMNGEAEDEAQEICRYSFTDGELARVPIQWPMEGKNRDVCTYAFDREGNVWLIANVYSADYSQMSRFLCRFNPEGGNLFSREITGQMGRDAAPGSMALDRQGRIYVFTSGYADEAGIWTYTAEGEYGGYISCDPAESFQVKGAADGKDGGFYVCFSRGADPESCILAEVDFEKGKLTELAGDFPAVSGFSADPLGQYEFLIYDGRKAFGCSLPGGTGGSPGEMTELFTWGDSEVNGYFVSRFGALEDGRYFCTVEDWQHDDRGIVLLTRTRWEEAPRRENIVLASVGGGGDLAALAVGFSRNSDAYHLTVKEYDSLTDLYNALLAKEPVDLIDLSGVDVEKLAGQGVLEDLAPWLEQSGALGAEDFLEGILNAYTFDGILTGIPESFTLRTVVGDGAGGTAGLSLEGLLGAAGRHPGALPLGETTREEMMRYLLMFNEETFIDWEAGQCHFDSEQFGEVLEMLRSFPEASGDNPAGGSGSGDFGRGDSASLPTMIQDGQVLFAVADLYGLDTYQLYEGMFGGNAACVGFPTPEGKGGTLLFPQNAYGIAAGSGNKAGAWKFIEGVLTRMDVEGMEKEEVYKEYTLPNRLPVLKRIWNMMTEYRMEADSERRADRFPIKIFDDGWSFQHHALTQEEIDVVLGLLKEAVPAFTVEDDAALSIINEEAAAYYSGQKGLEDVVKVIQNRVQLYVSENS